MKIRTIPLIMAMIATPLAAHPQQDLETLAQAMYFEANLENKNGMIAVGEVIVNRVRHPMWKDSIHEVVHQPWQFEYLRKHDDYAIPSFTKRLRAYRLASDLMNDDYTPVVGKNAYHYYNPNHADPDWRYYKLIRNVGNHTFLGFR